MILGDYPDDINWSRKDLPFVGGTIPWAGDPVLYKMEKGDELKLESPIDILIIFPMERNKMSQQSIIL